MTICGVQLNNWENSKKTDTLLHECMNVKFIIGKKIMKAKKTLPSKDKFSTPSYKIKHPNLSPSTIPVKIRLKVDVWLEDYHCLYVIILNWIQLSFAPIIHLQML